MYLTYTVCNAYWENSGYLDYENECPMCGKINNQRYNPLEKQKSY